MVIFVPAVTNPLNFDDSKGSDYLIWTFSSAEASPTSSFSSSGNRLDGVRGSVPQFPTQPEKSPSWSVYRNQISSK